MTASESLALSLRVERRIYLIRGEMVMLDYDLAALYGIETRALKQAVRRNYERFPADFMFELNAKEISGLVSQNVIPGRGKFGGARPMALLSRVWRCFRACCAANAPCR